MQLDKLSYSHSIQAIKGLRCSSHLDLLRGADAILVVLVHQFDLFFESNWAHPAPFTGLTHFFQMQGYSAVITFFVLSGYVVSLSLVERLSRPEKPWLNYAIARISRLYTVLVPSLFLCAFWDLLGMKLFGLNNVYNGLTLGSTSAPPSVLARETVGAFIGNIFSVQNILCPLYGSNGALWSLSCEFWYYVLFPVLLCVFYPKTRPFWQRVFLLGLGLAILYFIGMLMAWRFVLWLLGVALLLCPLLPRFKNSPVVWKYTAWVAIAVFVVRLNFTNYFKPSGSDHLLFEFILGVSCMACIYLSLYDRQPITSSFDKAYQSSTGYLAAFSYTIYLLHMPLLFFIRAAFIKDHYWPADFEHMVYSVLIFAIVIFYAWLISLITERKTPLVRRYMTRLADKLTGKVKADVKDRQEQQ